MNTVSHVNLSDYTPLPLPLMPDPACSMVVQYFDGLDHMGQTVSVPVINEQAWTLYYNSVEVVTMMTIGDWPLLLGLGYLINQQLLVSDGPAISSVDIDDDLRVIVVRTDCADVPPRLSRRIRTSGCGEGTMFEHVLHDINQVALSPTARLSQAIMLSTLQAIQMTPSLYLHAGAIHGCVLCKGDQMVAYTEDIGRHNAMDKIAGLMWLNQLQADEHWLFTTGRLTTEMVIKTIQMRIPILVSRSGFTAQAVVLAKRAGLTLIGRAKGKRWTLLAGHERLLTESSAVCDEHVPKKTKHVRP